MLVGILQAELVIDGALSLKDKRRVLASLKQTLRNDFPISVAEVDRMDDPRAAVLGITLASNDSAHCHSVLDTVLDRLRNSRGCHLGAHAKEVLAGA
jgi:uncharacterized protein YlxP (DUF503 family)